MPLGKNLLVRATLLAAFPPFASACRTTSGEPDSSEPLAVAAANSVEPALADADDGPTKAGGYFVAVPATSTSPAVVEVYDRLFKALDAYNRAHSIAGATSPSYAEEFEATGFTSLTGSEGEIECDREKCLLKLGSRVVTGRGGDGSPSLAARLTAALELAGVAPKVEGAARAFVIGNPRQAGVVCEQRGSGNEASYSCRFNLDGAAASTAGNAADTERGRLSDCESSPGVVRSAEEAKGALDGGGLLKLLRGPSDASPAVGFLRYAATGNDVQFLDLFLCGDVSHDSPRLAAGSGNPKAWARKPIAIGSVATLPAAQQDDAEMRLRATVAQVNDNDVVVEVKFELVPVARAANSASAVEVYGDDRFYAKLPKNWLN